MAKEHAWMMYGHFLLLQRAELSHLLWHHLFVVELSCWCLFYHCDWSWWACWKKWPSSKTQQINHPSDIQRSRQALDLTVKTYFNMVDLSTALCGSIQCACYPPFFKASTLSSIFSNCESVWTWNCRINCYHGIQQAMACASGFLLAMVLLHAGCESPKTFQGFS